MLCRIRLMATKHGPESAKMGPRSAEFGPELANIGRGIDHIWNDIDQIRPTSARVPCVLEVDPGRSTGFAHYSLRTQDYDALTSENVGDFG